MLHPEGLDVHVRGEYPKMSSPPVTEKDVTAVVTQGVM